MNSHINSWSDLNGYGINALTGEACAHGLRILCDLTEEGKDTLVAMFGGALTFTKGKNWNSGAEYSVMLPYGILPDLSIFCALRKYPHVTVLGSDVCGYNNEDFAEALPYIEDYNVAAYTDKRPCYRVYHSRVGPHAVGDRNIHQMSGRVN